MTMQRPGAQHAVQQLLPRRCACWRCYEIVALGATLPRPYGTIWHLVLLCAATDAQHTTQAAAALTSTLLATLSGPPSRPTSSCRATE